MIVNCKYYFSFFITLLVLSNIHAQSDLKLKYDKPAGIWEEALPVGIGRLGAMVFGGHSHEIIQLNEESIWAGSKINNNNPQALQNLKNLQSALFNSQYNEASILADKYFLGTPPRIRSYQPFGDLTIDYQWLKKPEAYRRELDLRTGTVTTSFKVDGKTFTQKVFATAPDNLIVVQMESEEGALINATISLKREKDAISTAFSNGSIQLSGQIIDKEDPLTGPGGEHMKFYGELRATSLSGTISANHDKLEIRDAKKVLLLFTAATDYNINKLDFDREILPDKICTKILDNANAFSSELLEKRHLQEYQAIFERVKLQLGKDSLVNLPTDKRLERLKKGQPDNGLIALYFQYGRYLLMSSSRKPGVLPANLQGIWNNDFEAAWNSDFHTNINLQMNYWPAEVCNLSETSEVLARFMELLTVPGQITAKEMYGTSGWTLHHLTDPFGRTGVAAGLWGITPMNGPWMTFPVYEHFLFTRDSNYLKELAYPLLKGSAEFVMGFLTQSPEGFLVTNPSHSPENSFYQPIAKKQSTLTYGATIDIEIANALFDYCSEAAGILNIDSDFVKKLKDAQKKFPPVKVNSKGCIQEWIRDFDEVEPGHRHMSHLLGLYPLSQFTPENPELFNAAKASIERRLSKGGGHTGWSRAWIISFYARLLNGDKAYENIMLLLQKSTLTNLFNTHPPFQIDGNFGGTAGIAEMLLQSHLNKIQLLPALPKDWPDGEVKGLCARGGFEISMKWKNNKLIFASIYSGVGGSCDVVYQDKMQRIELIAGETKEIKF